MRCACIYSNVHSAIRFVKLKFRMKWIPMPGGLISRYYVLGVSVYKFTGTQSEGPHNFTSKLMADQYWSLQGLTLSIWFTWPSGTWLKKLTCPAKIFRCPANICTSPAKLMYTAGKISTCPDWKISDSKSDCPVGHVTTKVYMPWDKIYMPGHVGTS